MAWTTQAPAKVNLDLRLLGVRDDGYHLVSTVLQSIALCDTVTLVRRPGPFALRCDTPGVPLDGSNLACKGARAMADALGVALDGLELTLTKRVPAEAGLGGGSADAVAAARLVAAAMDASVGPEALADIVGPLGADVGYFALGGTVRGEGIGDRLTPLPDVPEADVLIVRPPFGVSTRDAYGWHDDQDAERRTGSVDEYRNDLEAPVGARHPEIRVIVERLRRAGAWLAAMSGSGSACFGMFAPGADLSALEVGWPDGTRVWRSRTIGRERYAALTRVHPPGLSSSTSIV